MNLNSIPDCGNVIENMHTDGSGTTNNKAVGRVIFIPLVVFVVLVVLLD